MAQKLGNKILRTENPISNSIIGITNKVGNLFGSKELAAKAFAGLDNAEI